MAVLDLDRNRGRFTGKNPDPDKNSEQKTSLILWLLIQKRTIPKICCALSPSARDKMK